MTAEPTPARRTPLGVVGVCLLLVLYGVLWLLSWGLGGMTGDPFLATVALPVALSVLFLAYFLYRGHLVAWAITIAVVGASTVWRLGRVLGGHVDDISNAIVGVVLVAYLLAKHEFFRPVEE